MNKKGSYSLGVFLMLVIIMIISVRIDPSNANSKNIKINDYPYDIKDFSRSYKKHMKRWAELNQLRIYAAEITQKKISCDKVYSSHISDRSTKKHMLFFIDCENGTRVWLNEVEIYNKIKKTN